MLIHDPAVCRLGKLPPRHDPRTLRLVNYLKVPPPIPPESEDYTVGITDLGMMGNDKYGDCAYAAPGHMMQEWTARAGDQFTPTTEQILAAYAATGFDPKTGENDNGADMLSVLKQWKNVGIAGHKIDGFVAVDHTKLEEIRLAIWLFGNAYLGLGLPVTAQSQTIWDVVSISGDGAPYSWGAHAIENGKYAADGTETCVTWGGYKQMTPNFIVTYADEGFAALSKDWLSKASQKAPNALDYAALQDDLSLFTDS